MSQIRNFCIIAHIDHGKSTLADRFLEITKTIQPGKMMPQFLDSMDLERGKGITIKMHPVRMLWHPGGPERSEGQEFTLNLIDTPGHVDFSYEVSRALACVEGAILLVDATQGIQAQTLANLDLAKKQNLAIIPAVNKIDSPQAKVDETVEELANLLEIDRNEILKVSAKLGTGVEGLLKKVIAGVRPPAGGLTPLLRALIFDSKYDTFKGVVAFVRVMEGEIKAGDKIYLIQAKAESECREVGFFTPELKPGQSLGPGEIGYVATGIKEPGLVRVGDTMTKISNFQFPISKVEPLAGYQEPKPMVFASVFPENSADFDLLKDSLNKLKLNDAAFTFEPETKDALGRGFRCGFLGTLHTEIISERLRREFGLSLVISTPSVVYRIINQKGQELSVYSASEFPDPSQIKESLEPWVRLEIISHSAYLGPISELLKTVEANFIKQEYLGQKIRFYYELPLRKIISGFYDNLKSASSGYASMNYEVLGYRLADLVKIDILVAGKKEEPFSKIIDRSKASEEGKRIVFKLKQILPSQLFAVALQAAVGSDIVARETISAKRRDVIAPLYGGDYTRKKKLLEKQKKGKEKLKGRADIKIPPEVFLKMFTE